MCLGIPGRIVGISQAENNLAIVEIGGVRREVNIACIVDDEHPPAACMGDWVLVHVGFAMSRIDEMEALRTIDLLNEMEETQTELEALRKSGFLDHPGT